MFLPNRDGHSAWVSSSALRIAGITRETPDPPDGRIERAPDGEPSGTLHEGAQNLVGRHAPGVTPEDMDQGLLKGQAYLHSLGITAWQDAIVDTATSATTTSLRPAARAANAHRSGGRRVLVGSPPRPRADPRAGREEGAARSAERFAPTTVRRSCRTVSCENFTAAVLEPYLDAEGRATGNRGISFVQPTLLNEVVSRLDALGFQVHFHALAERAVRESLDAIEAARTANGPGDRRHHLAHIQVVHPDDLPRFAGWEPSRTRSRSGPLTKRRWTSSRSRSSVSPRILAVPVREPGAARGDARDGERLAASRPRPASSRSTSP